MDYMADGIQNHIGIGLLFVFVVGTIIGLYLGIYHNTLDRVRSWFVCPEPGF